MNKFKNSKTAKAVAGFVGLAAAFMMVGPSLASADTSYVFTKTLKTGVTDQEVMNLQTVLNSSADTQVAASGVGSKGMETKYFGGLTKAAVIKFQEKYASDILVPNGLTKGTGLVGASTRAKLNSMGAMTTGTPGTTSMVPGCTSTTGYSPTTGAPCSSNVVTAATGTGAVSAMIDTTSPMSGSVIKGASTKVAIFKLTNNGGAAAKITSVKMKRTGVSSDNTFRNVYLYNGDMRITDAASVASGMINFTDATGIVTVPAMSSITVGVMVEVDSAANTGETLGVMLTDVTTDGGTVSGLPLSGAQMQVVAAPSGMASVSFNSTTLPSSSSNIDPQSDYVVWQNTVNINSRDVLVSSLRFRQIGSVSAGDLKNFRLMVDGVQVGSAVEMVNSNQYVEFTFASPVTLKSGARTVKLLADIVGGSNKNFGFSIQQSVDAMFWDSQLGVVIAPLVNNASFTSISSATQTINQGTLTLTKTTDSPSGNIVLQGSGLTLGKFTLKAAGEKLKIENLTVNFTYTGAMQQSTMAIRNGAVFANGVQIGSTAEIKEDSNATLSYTQYNLGSALVVEPGHDVTLEVRGDVYNTGATSTGQFAANDTIVINIVAGTNNVYKQSSYGYISSGAVSGNSMTVASGSMTVAKATSYANQTVTVPQTAFKIGEYNVTTGSTEALNLNQFTLAFTGPTAYVPSLQDVYVVYGSKTTVVKASVASTSNTFSLNETLAAGATMSVKVYATINSSIANGAVVGTTLQVDATSQASGNSTSGTATGQTVTVGSGTLTVAIDPSTPVSVLAVGNTMPKVASFKFTALNDSFTIVDLTATTTDSSPVIELVFKDGATELGRQPFNGTTLTKTGLNVAVPANTNKIVDVYANLGSVGTNAATTSANVRVTVTSIKSRNSNGVETTTSYPSGISGNSVYVFKTKPTITNVALPTTVLTAGVQTVYQFTVTADAGGTVAWRKLSLNIGSSTPSGSVTTSGYAIYDAANQSTALSGVSAVQTSTGVTFTSTIDQEISGSKTYVVKATIGGTGIVAGASLSHNVQTAGAQAAPNTYAVAAAAAGSFIWSDESVIGHDDTTADWMNDFLVKNLPTDSETLTK